MLQGFSQLWEVLKNDPLARQVMEGVKLREIDADHIMNSKDEFHQPGEIIPEWQGRKNTRKKATNNIKNRQEEEYTNNSPNQNIGVKTRSMANLEKTRA